jgi:Mn-dependent DtxR family transcriptional regulator
MRHHRHPWDDSEIKYVRSAKGLNVRHKVIARQLGRTPRSVDQQVARMKEYGLLAMHRKEEELLLEQVEREAHSPEMYPE